MLAGTLRKRVVIQSRTVSQNTVGQQVDTWSDVLNGDIIGTAKSVTAIAAGATTTLTSVAHGFSDGMLVKLAGITGQANLLATFSITGCTTDTFQVRFATTGLTLTLSSATATQYSGIPVAIEPLYAFEKMGQGQASEVHQVSLRYNAALAEPIVVAAMRICYGSRVLDVVGSINVSERNHDMTLTCTEGLTLG